jgi:cation transporter-like permease
MMPDQRDTVLIEQAKIQRMRLGSALLYGHIGERRTVNDHAKRLMGSIIVAAVACAACVGVSFVSQLLSDQANAAPAGTVVQTVSPTPSEAP